jgi:hypothetical protein
MLLLPYIRCPHPRVQELGNAVRLISTHSARLGEVPPVRGRGRLPVRALSRVVEADADVHPRPELRREFWTASCLAACERRQNCDVRLINAAGLRPDLHSSRMVPGSEHDGEGVGQPIQNRL